MTETQTTGPPGPLAADELRAHRRLLARGELPLGRADLPARQPAAARAAAPRARQAAAARPLGHHAGAELRLRAPQPRHPRSATSTRSTSPGPGTAGPASSPTPTSRAPTPRSTRTSRRDEEGMRRLFRQFSFPGGIPSHVAPETPGSIHEGGELGYALVHAYGAAFDNPDLLVAASSATARPRPARSRRAGTPTSSSTRRATARCCRSCTSTATRSPTRPCSRASRTTSCARCSTGYGYQPYFVEGDDPATMHQLMAATLDEVLDEIREIQARAREGGRPSGRAGR